MGLAIKYEGKRCPVDDLTGIKGRAERVFYVAAGQPTPLLVSERTLALAKTKTVEKMARFALSHKGVWASYREDEDGRRTVIALG